MVAGAKEGRTMTGIRRAVWRGILNSATRRCGVATLLACLLIPPLSQRVFLETEPKESVWNA